MKKITLILVLSFLLFSCNKNVEDNTNKDFKNDKVENFKKNDNFLKGEKLSDEEIKKINENLIYKKLDKISNKEEVKELYYPEIINYENLAINKIDISIIKNSILDKELFIDLE